MKIGSGWYGMGGGVADWTSCFENSKQTKNKTPTHCKQQDKSDTRVSCILQKVSPHNKITHKIPGTW